MQSTREFDMFRKIFLFFAKSANSFLEKHMLPEYNQIIHFKQREDSFMNIGQVSAFVIYFMVVLAIGVYFFLKDKGGDDKQYY